jgi:predicted esterase
MNGTEHQVTSAHITVPRTARYYMVGRPAPTVRDLWIVCHGYGQLAGRFVEQFVPFVDDTRLIVAPEGLSRFYVDPRPPHTPTSKVGALWMTREDRDAEIADIVTYLDTLAEHLLGMLADRGLTRDRLRVHALGFSQGVPVVCRWAARGTIRVDHLTLWGGRLPDDVNIRVVGERYPGFSVDFVSGSRDWWVSDEIVAEHDAVLKAAGIPHRLRTFEGGHSLDDATIQALLAGE